MKTINLPGFTAEASLSVPTAKYRPASATPSATSISGVLPQFRFQFGGDPDIGDYLRCRANGGGDLVCRFFGGLPPFTIGGRLF